MKYRFIIFALIFLYSPSWGQIPNGRPENVSSPITIKWVDGISGNFSFTKNWSYPLAVEMKADGKAGCADGGFCPERCYSMLDSNGIVLKEALYQML